MGTIQLEILKKNIENRFNMTIDFGPCEILYKETIGSTVLGCGHFEPLNIMQKYTLNWSQEKEATAE